MKYQNHWLFKLLALVLAIVSGVVLVLGAAGLVMEHTDFYEDVRLGQLYNNVGSYCGRAAEAVFDNFAWRDTGIEPKLFERFFRWGADVDAVDKLEYGFYHSIRNVKTGQTLTDNTGGVPEWGWMDVYQFDVRRGYVTEMPKAEFYPPYDDFKSVMDGMVYVDLTGAPLPPLGEGVTDIEYYVVSDDPSVNWQNVSSNAYSHSDAGGADYDIYRIEYTYYESYEVEIRMTPEQVDALMGKPMDQEFLPKFTAKHGDVFEPMAIWGGVGLLLALLWLALVAGRSPHREELKPQGLNRIPLDIWLVLAVSGGIALVMAALTLLDGMVRMSLWGSYEDLGGMETFWVETALVGLCGGGMGLLVSMFCMALAAQLKMGDGYWLKHTAIGLSWRYGWKFVKKTALWCWNTAKKVGAWLLTGCRRMGRAARGFVRLLPLTWQWVIVSGGLWMLMLFCCIVGFGGWGLWPFILGAVLTAALVFCGAWCFGQLRDAAKKMSEGNLEEKIDCKYLPGCFGEFAGHLNALGDTCIEAAKQQMQSERMKSELITNVSHDIKTPLTSIINYVDLLQMTDDEQQRTEYLEVLSRQSQRLKKLIEDLMEMSRANSGNVAVEITPTDISEAVNQALGEFADTLESCGLKTMCRMPSEPVMALCDGKHLWRVLSNCLSNVVKYALPGTRVYVDVERQGQKVEISIKNISAQMLNITAGELMERFVRGDASRNTEGNGLGLNIAKSLMELQNGRLELVVDGDLFKVVLTLNAA